MAIKFFLHSPTVAFAALVNQSSITYPIDEVQWDGATTGAYTDVLRDVTIIVRDLTAL